MEPLPRQTNHWLPSQRWFWSTSRAGVRSSRTVDGRTNAAQGALVEPLSIITNALYNKCNIKPGDDVVVTGCGIIGLMSAEVARASGARVAITGIAQDRDTRLKRAKERGFITLEVSPDNSLAAQLKAGVKDDQGVPFGDHGADGKIDLLIECSGVPQVYPKQSRLFAPKVTFA